MIKPKISGSIANDCRGTQVYYSSYTGMSIYFIFVWSTLHFNHLPLFFSHSCSMFKLHTPLLLCVTSTLFLVKRIELQIKVQIWWNSTYGKPKNMNIRNWTILANVQRPVVTSLLTPQILCGQLVNSCLLLRTCTSVVNYNEYGSFVTE